MSLQQLNNMFAPVLDTVPNSTVTSNVVTFDSTVTVTSLSTNLVILKNGTNAGSGVITFNATDTIALQLTSSVHYSDQVFGNIQIQKTVDNIVVIEEHVFCCTTKSKQNPIPEFFAKEPFELTASYDGTAYVPDNSQNQISVYSDITDTKTATINNFSTPVTISSVFDYVVICSFYDKKVYKIDIKTNQIYDKIDVSGTPYSAIAVPISPRTNFQTNLWITLSDKNQVIVLDETDTVINTFTVGNRPTGMCIDRQYENVWIANNHDDTVSHFSWDDTAKQWNLTNVSLDSGCKPLELTCDYDNNVWVTGANSNKVYKITTNNTVTSYVVGNNPRGIAFSNNLLWIALHADGTLVSMDTSGNITNTVSIDSGSIPFAVSALPLPMNIKYELFDSLSLADSSAYNSVKDTLSLSDVVSRNSVVDTLTLSDINTYNKISDSFSISDSTSIISTLLDSVTVTDSPLSIEYTSPTVSQIIMIQPSTMLVGTKGSISATESSIFSSNTGVMNTANYTYTLPVESGTPDADPYFANTVLIINGE